jgi:hypothetical protein
MVFSTLKSFGCQLRRSKGGDQKKFVDDYGNWKLTTEFF